MPRNSVSNYGKVKLERIAGDDKHPMNQRAIARLHVINTKRKERKEACQN